MSVRNCTFQTCILAPKIEEPQVRVSPASRTARARRIAEKEPVCIGRSEDQSQGSLSSIPLHLFSTTTKKQLSFCVGRATYHSTARHMMRKVTPVRCLVGAVLTIGITAVALISGAAGDGDFSSDGVGIRKLNQHETLEDEVAAGSASTFLNDVDVLKEEIRGRALETRDNLAAAVTAGGINTFTKFLQPNDVTNVGLNSIENGLFLAGGFTARMIAIAGHKIPYADGSKSYLPFHDRPDGAHVFADPRPENPGGWIYASNSEVVNDGGVGALTFDRNGNVIDYKMVLTGTTMK